MQRFNYLLLLILAMVFLYGCAYTPYVSMRLLCVNCDSDLTKWKQDCLPTCLDIEQNPSNYNFTIPQNWELAGVQKQQFTLKMVVGGSGTETKINCLCVFQKLNPSDHQQAIAMFGKTK